MGLNVKTAHPQFLDATAAYRNADTVITVDAGYHSHANLKVLA
jgi:single-stranded DNA-specific DHH superfamily exonuclease